MTVKLFIKNRISKIVGTLATKNVSVSTFNKQISIRNTNRISELKINQFISFSDETDKLFFINKITYSSITNSYIINITGNISSNVSYRDVIMTIYDTEFEAISENAELDLGVFDIETLTQINDIDDISAIKDKISKQIVLPDTDNNRQVFGNIDNLNKQVDSFSSYRIFDEYNGIKQVDAEVFVDGIKVFYGKLILGKISRDSKGSITYMCTILGELQSFKQKIGDSMLSDLDLISLEHTYTIQNIKNSWNGFKGIGQPYNVGTLDSIQVYNWETDTIEFQETEFGKGYTYPHIDYGDKFTNLDEKWNNFWNNQYNKIKLQNFRPAVYAKEYLNRIAKDIGYEIEIKGDANFLKSFDRLIIPNAQEKFRTKKEGIVGHFKKPILSSYFLGNPSLGYVSGAVRSQFDFKKRLFPLYAETEEVSEFVEMTGQFGDSTYSTSRKSRNTFKCLRTFESLVQLGYNFNYNTGTFTAGFDTRPRGFKIQIVKRNQEKFWEGNTLTEVYTTTGSSADSEVFDWEVLYEKYEYIGDSIPSLGITRNYSGSVELPLTSFVIGDEVQVRIVVEPNYPLGVPEDDVSISNARLPTIEVFQFDLKFGKSKTPLFYEPQNNDRVRPEPPEMKQIDFLKSLANIYNLMIYEDKDIENKIIIQTYDDYYNLFDKRIISSVSYDWTNKIDWNQPFSITSNVEINKDYVFKFEEDSDTLNENYKKQTNEVYSTLEFMDSFGLKDKKEIKPKFAPSIPSQSGTNRLQSLYFKGDNYLERQQMVTKPRIIHHSGVYACDAYDIVEEKIVSELLFSSWIRRSQVNDVPNGKNNIYYNLSSNYLFSDGQSNRGIPWENESLRVINKPQPIEDVHFFRPQRFYFNIWNDNFLNFDGSYKYYRNRIGELTDISLKVVECMAYLNLYDLSELNLRVPIFIDTPHFGGAYFKIIEVISNYKETFSKVKLQQIV